MFGNVTALEGLHVTGKYRDKSMQHTCSRPAAWDPHAPLGCSLSTAVEPTCNIQASPGQILALT